MKKLTKTVTSALLLASALVGCGTQPQINQTIPTQQLKQTQQNQRVRSYYFLGQLENSSFRPDKNGHQFGFNYVTLEYKTFMPDDQQRLEIAYSNHSASNYIRIDHTTKVGTPEEKREAISQDNTKKVQDLSFFIRTLLTSNDEDKQNLDRVLTVLNKILGSTQLQTKRVRRLIVHR